MSNCLKCGFSETRGVGAPKHAALCEAIDLDSAKWYLDYHYRRRRDKENAWMEHYQRAMGKIAILKHENNKLRAANRAAVDLEYAYTSEKIKAELYAQEMDKLGKLAELLSKKTSDPDPANPPVPQSPPPAPADTAGSQ